VSAGAQCVTPLPSPFSRHHHPFPLTPRYSFAATTSYHIIYLTMVKSRSKRICSGRSKGGSSRSGDSCSPTTSTRSPSAGASQNADGATVASTCAAAPFPGMTTRRRSNAVAAPDSAAAAIASAGNNAPVAVAAAAATAATMGILSPQRNAAAANAAAGNAAASSASPTAGTRPQSVRISMRNAAVAAADPGAVVDAVSDVPEVSAAEASR